MKLVSLGFVVALVWTAPALAQDCGCDPPLPDVVLTVNGTKFRQADVFSTAAKQRIDNAKQLVVDERKNELQLLINSKLLAAEARKRGMSPTRLFKQEVTAKVADPTEADIQDFYNRNHAGIAGTLDSSRAQIIAAIRNDRETEAAEKFAAQLRGASQVKLLVDNVTPPATPSERSRVFATLNGNSITSGDVEDALKPTVFMVQQQIYGLRKSEIDLKVNDTLLMAEAQKRGVTAPALYDAEITQKVPAVTDAEAREFFTQNRARINGEFEEVRSQLIQYLSEQKKNDVEKAFGDKLRAAASIQIFLPAPFEPVYAIDTEGRPFKGPRNAPVTVVEFIDIECRTCGEPYQTLRRLSDDMNSKMRLVVMHYPLSQHKHAQKAAEAAEAAGEQGKFDEYVDLLFKNQQALDLPDLKNYATQLGLDRRKFDGALDGTRLSDVVDHDRLEGDRLGINRTPTVFVNGRTCGDLSYQGLRKAVEEALKPR